MAGPLHPQMQAVLDRRAAAGLPAFWEGSAADARATFATAQATLPPDRGARVRTIKDLTILLGLRYDRYGTDTNTIVNNPFFQQRYGFANTLTIDGLDALLPRFSANYNWSPEVDFLPFFAHWQDSLQDFYGGFTS